MATNLPVSPDPRKINIAKWILCTLVCAVVPFLLAYFVQMINSKKPAMHILLGSGQLLIVVFLISAACIGELVFSDSSKKAQRGLLVVILFILGGFSGMVYAVCPDPVKQAGFEKQLVVPIPSKNMESNNQPANTLPADSNNLPLAQKKLDSEEKDVETKESTIMGISIFAYVIASIITTYGIWVANEK